MNIEQLVLMIDAECATKLALAEQVVECDSRSDRDA
jgi:hypothetical protein